MSRPYRPATQAQAARRTQLRPPQVRGRGRGRGREGWLTLALALAQLRPPQGGEAPAVLVARIEAVLHVLLSCVRPNPNPNPNPNPKAT